MTAKIVENIRNIVFPILGVIFILLGGAMVLASILWGINAF